MTSLIDFLIQFKDIYFYPGNFIGSFFPGDFTESFLVGLSNWEDDGHLSPASTVKIPLLKIFVIVLGKILSFLGGLIILFISMLFWSTLMFLLLNCLFFSPRIKDFVQACLSVCFAIVSVVAVAVAIYTNL